MLDRSLFEYKFLRHFMELCDLQILRVEPRNGHTALPFFLLSAYVRAVSESIHGRRTEKARGAGLASTWVCYWLWTFEVVRVENGDAPLLTRQSLQTAPKG